MLEVYSRKQINAKIPDIEKTVADHDHDQYITTSEFNKLTAENFKARFAQADLVTKTDFDSRLRKINTELITNKFEHKVIGDKFKEVETFDLSYFKSKSHFVDNDGTQNYLVLQPVNRCFKGLLMLVVVNIFIFGNLKVCLMKRLILLPRVIILLLQNQVMLMIK